MNPVMDAEVSAQLLLFAEQTTDFVGIADGWGRVLYLNPAARKRLGVADPTNLTLADVFPVDEVAFYYEVIRPQLLRTGAWNGEIRVNVAGEGTLKMYASTSAKLGPGGAIDGLVVYAREVPRSDPAGIIDDSEVDDSTGVLTTSAFDDRMRRALAAEHRFGETHALVLVEIVGICDANETFDQPAAATIMRSLAGRLKRVARTIDIAGRVGEQELGLLLGGVRGRGEALRIAQVVYESLVDRPLTTVTGEVAVSIRCGAATTKPGDSPDELVQRAAAAMSDEPAVRDVAVGVPIASVDRRDQTASLDDFRVGMSRGDVRSYAQPVVDLRSGVLVGYRGMARWHHRDLGTLTASAFIDMIADRPIASQVDLYVARETAAVLTLSVGDTPLRLYTPGSRRLIADARTEQYLSEIADAFFLSMGRVRLQVSRPLLDRWSPALQDALTSLRDAGVALVLTGVEHVGDADALAAHPFDELHISRRLTSAAISEPDARLVVSTIVRLAHDHAAGVGAIGVDTSEHRDLLVELGCDYGIGELYGRPEPANDID